MHAGLEKQPWNSTVSKAADPKSLAQTQPGLDVSCVVLAAEHIDKTQGLRLSLKQCLAL